jgi:glycosyltransferase involved in cell wall biosynthesis
MKNVLFIQHGLGFGGATKSLLLLQKQLYKEFNLYTISQPVSKKTRKIIDDIKEYSELTELDFPSIHYHTASQISIEEFSRRKNYTIDNIIDFIKKKDIDIVHINTTLFSYILKPIKEKTHAKIIVHFREMLPDNRSTIDKFIIENHIKYSDKIIAITYNEIRHYPKSDKIEIVPNPHEFDLTDSLITEKENDDIIVGMCANFMEYKGQLEFLEMAKIVEENCENIDLKFEIIGYPKNTLKEIVKRIIKPGFKQKFDEQVKKLKIKNLQIIKFTFNIYEEISSWDIVVRPDYTGQPWGRDIIEAMAMKKPIVATGTSEFFVENDKTGFLLPPRNPQAMAERVIELIENEEMRKEFGERGYQKIRKMCDIDEYGKRIKEIYEQILQ